MLNPRPSTSNAPIQSENEQNEQRRGLKRVVDADDETTSAPDPKRPNIELDSNKKANLHKAMAVAYLRICEQLGFIKTVNMQGPQGTTYADIEIKSEYYQVHVSNVIISHMFTAHRGLRHEALGLDTPVRKQIHSEVRWKFMEIEQNMNNKIASDMLKKTLSMFDFSYDKPASDDRNHWWGTFGPILSIATLNKVRRDELRVGHSEMTVGLDNEGRTKTVNISQWGLMPEHHILLEGITMPPSKRSAIAQSVGPMTALITLTKQKGQEKFEGKWSNAAKRALSHIPDIDDLIKGIKGKKASEVREVLRAVADLLLITESREAHRASFPWNALALCLLTREQAIHYLRRGTGGELVNVADAMINSNLLTEIDYSGRGCFKAYAEIRKKMMTLPGTMTQDQASQVLFHSIFGTYTEDLGILAAVTTRHHWSTRAELGNCMQKMGSSRTTVEVLLPEFKYFSRLASANVTGLLTSTSNQITSRTVFSGKRIKVFSDEFFELLRKESGIVASSGKSLSALAASYRATKLKLLEGIEKNNKQLMTGTVDWFPVSQIDQKEPQGPAFMPSPTGRLFLSRS